MDRKSKTILVICIIIIVIALGIITSYALIKENLSNKAKINIEEANYTVVEDFYCKLEM